MYKMLCSIMAANYFLLFLMIYQPFLPLFQSALAPPLSPSASAWRRIERSAARPPINRAWPCWNVQSMSTNWSGRRRLNASSRKYIRKVPQRSRPFVCKSNQTFAHFLETAAETGGFAVYHPQSQLRALLCAQTSRFRSRL